MASPAFTAIDHAMMARALRLAERGAYTTRPNPMVGCVIAHDGEVVGEGFHQRKGGPHAEVFALEAAGERARGATAYVTLEPCPMCAGAIVQSRIARLVFGAWDPKAGACGSIFDIPAERRLNHRVLVTGGLLERESRELLQEFFRAKRDTLSESSSPSKRAS